MQERLNPDCSAFMNPWVADRFYVWIPTADVLERIYAIRPHVVPNILRGKVRVPSSDVPSVFALARERNATYTEGSWVKITRGLFEGDYGLVEKILRTGQLMQVLAMPRIALGNSALQSERPGQTLATVAWLTENFPNKTVTEDDGGVYFFWG